MSHRRDDGGYQPTSPSEMSVSFHETTRRNILEDNHLHTSCRANLKSQLNLYTPYSGVNF
jgi:hypothetical protein